VATGKVRFIRDHWQLIALVLFVLFQLVGIFIGFSLFVIGGINLHITVHALVMFTYKVWQKITAYLHHRWTMKTVRGHYLPYLFALLPGQDQLIRKLAGEFSTFDTFKYQLSQQVSGYTDDLWLEVVRRSFGVNPPSVSVVVPIYDIEQDLLGQMMAGMAAQTYPNIGNVYLVVNDANDPETVDYLNQEIATKYASAPMRFTVTIEPAPGKRFAQMHGFELCFEDGCEFLIHADGDGISHQDFIANHIPIFLSDERIGLITGDVRVINTSVNFLTRITGIRYLSAFWDERGSHSRGLIRKRKGEMICGSGPDLAFRVSVLKRFVRRWFYDEFAGLRSDYGDDRDATLKTMEEGYQTIVNVESIVWTDCPTDIATYRNQQTRWNKSAWKYNIKMYLGGTWHKLSFPVRFSVAYLTFYPFIVLAAIITVLLLALHAFFVLGNPGLAWEILWPYIVTVIAVQWIFMSSTGLLLFRDPWYLIAPLYTILWFWVQIPARYVAARDILKPGWMTRKKRE